MFARIPSKLPEDPKFPPDLAKLGYFVDEEDRIKSIDWPGEYFQYKISTSERHRDVHREAMHRWIRDEITRRMIALDVPPFYLPQLASSKPADEACFPIYMTPASQLALKKRVVVMLGRDQEDLGVWSYRDLTHEQGISHGSCVGFVRELFERSLEASVEPPGIVILNPGQYLYSYRAKEAMNMVSWDAQPRASAVHPPARIDPVNRIGSQGNARDHLQFVTETILNDPSFISPQAKIFFVGAGNGANEIMEILDQPYWKNQCDRIAAIALTSPVPVPKSLLETNIGLSNQVLKLLHSKSRTWALSHHEVGEPLLNPDRLDDISKWKAQLKAESNMITSESGQSRAYGRGIPDEITLSPEVSGGESLYAEGVMVKAYPNIVKWFGEIVAQGDAYINEPLAISEAVVTSRASRMAYLPPSNSVPWGEEHS